MKHFLINLWQEEDGAETAEWLVVAALLIAVGLAVYNSSLDPALSNAATAIGTEIQNIAENGPPAGP